MVENQDDTFNASKAELFEALGHPTRIRVLQELAERPLPFSELKRAAGLESNGLLTFHLGKLSDLVVLNPEGAYALTDEGREALRIIDASRTQNYGRGSSLPAFRLPLQNRQKALLAGFVLILIVLGSVAVYQQEQIAALSAKTATSVTTSVAGTGQPIQAADVEAANISVGDLNYIAVNANANRVYVERLAQGSVNYSLTVIDASSNTVVANVSLPPIPRNPEGGYYCSDLAVDDSTGMVYAISTGTAIAGEIVAVNGSTDSVTGEVPLSLGALASGFTCIQSLDSSTHVLWGTATYPEPGHPEGLVGSVIGVNVLTGSVVENVSVGFAAGYAVVDPHTGMVYADGCTQPTADVCSSQRLAIINGTSGSLVTTVSLDSQIYPTMTMDQSTGIVYVTGGPQLAAVNGTSGNVIFRVNLQTCGRSSIAVIPSTDQVLMVPTNSTYLLVYDGATGSLVNMYSFSSRPDFMGYDASTGELYVWLSGDLLALQDVQSTGNVNAALIDVGCGPPNE